jgi:ribulose-5-phosphate 4-epimerase/fuculose-1-phosphate aldolase
VRHTARVGNAANRGDSYVPAATAGAAPPAAMSDREWNLRLRLAAAYRAVDYLGWSELTANHISLRLQGDPPEFLINPYGLLYSEITASNLVRIDIDGNVLSQTEYPINPAGFNIHAAMHAARADAHCVLHAHTIAGMTVSCLKDGLLPLTLEGTDFHNRVGYHDFEGPSLEVDERARLVAALGNNIALILRNHGLVTIGETVDSAFLRMYRLVLACEIQMRVLMCGQPFTRISADTLEKSAQRHDWFFRIGPGGRTIGHGELDFSAVMRLMARIDPSFQE